MATGTGSRRWEDGKLGGLGPYPSPEPQGQEEVVRRLVLVTWVDSFGCSSSWQNMDEPLQAPSAMTCRSVGWLAHDGDECKVLVPHIAEVGGDEPDQGCGDMAIPTVSITSIEELSVSAGMAP